MLSPRKQTHFAVLKGCVMLRDDALGGHPLEGALLPGFPHGAFAAVEAVASGGEFQVFDGDAVGLEGIAEGPAILGRDGCVVLGVSEEGRWGCFR